MATEINDVDREDSSPMIELVPQGLRSFAAGLPGLSAIAKMPEERRDLWTIGLLAAVLFIPWLGAVGLWDPWEPHYGEVAREMVWRHDYVFPYWESAWFFSKPVLLMWMMCLGMNLVPSDYGVGINAPPAGKPLPELIEWFMRMPVALLAIAGLVLMSLAIRRTLGRRMAFLTAFVLMTSPYYFFLARQCMEDMPLVACVMLSLGSFIIAEFTTRTLESGEVVRASPIWWYLMYAFAAFAALAKESLGIVLPGLAIFTYLVLSADWALLKRARLVQGAILFLAIAGPWYLTLINFPGRDDEASTFAKRLVWDNFLRFFGQVHTTTPAWTFTYFIEQIGWGFFPWVALIPGAIGAVGKLNLRGKDPATRVTLFFAGWAVSVFIFFTCSGTKFHHYIFPVFPALAFCVAYFIDRCWKEGLEKNMLYIFAGLGIAGVIGANLYTWHDDSGVHSGLKHFTDLFVYNYTRPYPFDLDNRDTFAMVCGICGVGVVMAFLAHNKRLLFMAFGVSAVAVAIWGSWFYWRWMSPHWSQRDEFWAFYKERQPNEPITGYILGPGWRGETFYGRNTLKEINEPGKLRQFLSQAGPEYVIVEQARYQGMRQQLGEQFTYRIVDRSSNKFFLVEVDKT